MKNINIEFINFWPKFEPISFFNHWKKIYKHNNIIWNYNTNKPADVLVSSVFGNIDNILSFKGIKILYVRENINYLSYNKYKTNFNNFDLIIGFKNFDKEINVPYYYTCIQEYNIHHNNIKNFYNRKPICLVSRNRQSLRLKLLNSFHSKNYIVDCPSVVGRNMDIVVEDKIDFIKNYYFNICPENSYANGYITEKLFDSCVAGCIPIYYGCEKLNGGFYNSNRILHIKKDLSNYNNVIAQTIYLLNNKKELIEFMSQKPFATNYQDYIDKIRKNIQNKLKILL